MSRLRQLLAAAALTGSLVLAVALQDGARQLDPPMACDEWAQELRPWQDTQSWHTFYLGVADAQRPPELIGARPIGACAGGSCMIEREDCPDTQLAYDYAVSPAVNGRRIVKIRAPKPVASAWRAWSKQGSDVHWLGSYGQAVDTCVANLPAAQCRSLLMGVNECWIQQDGELCRYGRTPAGEACTPQSGARPLPCIVDRGAGSEMEDLARVIADEELE